MKHNEITEDKYIKSEVFLVSANLSMTNMLPLKADLLLTPMSHWEGQITISHIHKYHLFYSLSCSY